MPPSRGKGRERAGAACRGGIHLAAVYLHDAIGVAARCNLDLLEGAAAVLRGLAGQWVLGGDFNCTPGELAATGFLKGRYKGFLIVFL